MFVLCAGHKTLADMVKVPSFPKERVQKVVSGQLRNIMALAHTLKRGFKRYPSAICSRSGSSSSPFTTAQRGSAFRGWSFGLRQIARKKRKLFPLCVRAH
jgi:hypothetical protein